VQCVGKRGLVDQASASGVDQNGALLHARDPRRIDQHP